MPTQTREKNLLFSIVIPSYNYAERLPRAIKSVLSQKGGDFDLLVINDGSTDNTAEAVRGILDKEGDIFRFIQRKNAGVAATRNFGIDETKGRYLIFLDADDEMTSGALTHYRNQLRDNQATGMLAGGYISKSPSGQTKKRPVGLIADEPKTRMKAYLLDKSLVFANGAVAISRQVFDSYRYPEKFRTSEDIPMFAFILANFLIVSIDAPLAVTNRHDDSLRHNVTHAMASGLLVVDEVFNPQRMPEELQVLKVKFLAQRCLSLFRSLFLAGKYRQARSFYHQAIRAKPAVIFKMSYLVKYLKSLTKLLT